MPVIIFCLGVEKELFLISLGRVHTYPSHRYDIFRHIHGEFWFSTSYSVGVAITGPDESKHLMPVI